MNSMNYRLSISRLDLLVCRLDALIDELQTQGSAALGRPVSAPPAHSAAAVPLLTQDGMTALQKAERLSRERVVLQARLSEQKDLLQIHTKEQLKETLTQHLGVLQGVLAGQGAPAQGEPSAQDPALDTGPLSPEQREVLKFDISRLQLELLGLYDSLIWTKSTLVEVECSDELAPLVDEVSGKSRGTCPRFRCPKSVECA